MIYLLITLILFLIYIYFGYIFLTVVLSIFINKKIFKNEYVDAELPKITLLIAAFNEERDIARKIENSLELDYPAHLLDIIVVNDSSTDRTGEIVSSFASKGVKLLNIHGRKGKTEARNQAMKCIETDIVIFSDATTEYEKNSLKKLIRNFHDPNIGMVCGHLIYKSSSKRPVSIGQKLFWKYEVLLKHAQTRLGTLTGSSGCMTALRTHLYEDLPPHIIEDFTLPLIFIKKGFRIVFEPEAKCYENALTKAKVEFDMRVRVIRGGMTGLFHAYKILNPFKFSFISFQLISHKVLRWLSPLLILLIFVISTISLLVVPQNNFIVYSIFYAQLLFFFTVLLVSVEKRICNYVPLLSLPYYFFILNIASIVAIYKMLTEPLPATWIPQRKEL